MTSQNKLNLPHMTAQSQLELLRRRINGPLPGMEAHERMMPSTRRTIYRDITIPDDAKKPAYGARHEDRRQSHAGIIYGSIW